MKDHIVKLWELLADADGPVDIADINSVFFDKPQHHPAPGPDAGPYGFEEMEFADAQVQARAMRGLASPQEHMADRREHTMRARAAALHASRLAATPSPNLSPSRSARAEPTESEFERLMRTHEYRTTQAAKRAKVAADVHLREALQAQDRRLSEIRGGRGANILHNWGFDELYII